MAVFVLAVVLNFIKLRLRCDVLTAGGSNSDDFRVMLLNLIHGR